MILALHKESLPSLKKRGQGFCYLNHRRTSGSRSTVPVTVDAITNGHARVRGHDHAAVLGPEHARVRVHAYKLDARAHGHGLSRRVHGDVRELPRDANARVHVFAHFHARVRVRVQELQQGARVHVHVP